MARRGVEWHGRHGAAWQGSARPGGARRGKARQAWQGAAGHGLARRGKARLGRRVRHSIECRSQVDLSEVEIMFLSEEDLITLTGRHRKAHQIETLKAMGITFWINAIGRPIVPIAAIEGRSAAKQAPKREWSPPATI